MHHNNQLATNAGSRGRLTVLPLYSTQWGGLEGNSKI